MSAHNEDKLDQLGKQLSVRVQRSIKHGEQLAEQIKAWMDANPVTVTPVIADDRLSWELRVDYAEPPLAGWATHFDDGIHNLRAALDNLTWGLAVLDGTAPMKPNRVQFPIVEKREHWAAERSRIVELPQPTQSAIESVQPFQRSGVDGLPEHDALLLLNRLSNTEKHRLALLPIINPTELTHGFSVEFGSDEEAALNVPPDVTISADVFIPEATIMQQVTKTPIVKVKGHYGFTAQVVVQDPVVGHIGVTTVLAQLATYVPQVIDHVLRAVAMSDHSTSSTGSSPPAES